MGKPKAAFGSHVFKFLLYRNSLWNSPCPLCISSLWSGAMWITFCCFLPFNMQNVRIQICMFVFWITFMCIEVCKYLFPCTQHIRNETCICIHVLSPPPPQHAAQLGLKESPPSLAIGVGVPAKGMDTSATDQNGPKSGCREESVFAVRFLAFACDPHWCEQVSVASSLHATNVVQNMAIYLNMCMVMFYSEPFMYLCLLILPIYRKEKFTLQQSTIRTLVVPRPILATEMLGRISASFFGKPSRSAKPEHEISPVLSKPMCMVVKECSRCACFKRYIPIVFILCRVGKRERLRYSC